MNCNNNISDNNFGAFLAYRKKPNTRNIKKNIKKSSLALFWPRFGIMFGMAGRR